MTTFEFISVFISMIFGLSLAHLLSGAMQSFGILLPKGGLRNIVAAYFAASMIAWLFFVRRLLA